MRAFVRMSLATALVGCAASGLAGAAVRTTPACRGRDVVASFRLVPGSRGAGNVLYALRLRNISARTCFVSGLAQLRLVGRNGASLPTQVRAAGRGRLTAVKVDLTPGGWATATARFSPDVPGPGEGGARPCEPVASRVRVAPPPGGGWTVGPVVPATSVCSHGSMTLTALVAGREPPGPS
jgi:hypothetical protein